MRKFSEELVKDREFEIGGELFKWRYPYWEEFADQLDKDIAAVNAPQNGGEAVPDTVRSGYESFIERIPMFLNPKNDAHKRFKALANRKVDAVPRYQFAQLYRLLVQVTSNLPTTPPSAPEAGGGDNDTGSSDASSSTEETPTG